MLIDHKIVVVPWPRLHLQVFARPDSFLVLNFAVVGLARPIFQTPPDDLFGLDADQGIVGFIAIAKDGLPAWLPPS
jgi:hypothetical protein